MGPFCWQPSLFEGDLATCMGQQPNGVVRGVCGDAPLIHLLVDQVVDGTSQDGRSYLQLGDGLFASIGGKEVLCNLRRELRRTAKRGVELSMGNP